jgi:replicative DNA helicase
MKTDYPQLAPTREELLTRAELPPQSIEAEMAILCSCFFLPQALDSIAYTLKPEAFYATAHKYIYESMLSLHRQGQPTDLICVAEHLQGKRLLESVGGQAYLLQLANSNVPRADLAPYERLVTDKWVRRELIRSAVDIIALAKEIDSPLENVLDTAEQKVFALSLLQSTEDTVHNAYVAEIAHQKLSETSRISRTGLNALDDLIIGLEADTLTVLAGRPSMGKTAIGLSLAMNQALIHNKPVAYFSLEMTKEQLEYRFWSMVAAHPAFAEHGVLPVTGHRIRQHLAGEVPFTKEEYENVTLASVLSMGVNLYINDRRDISVQGIAGEARRIRAKEKALGLVVVDYIQLLQTDGGDYDSAGSAGKSNEIAKIARGLYCLAKDLSCPVLVLSQLNRNVETRNDKRPTMSDLAQSGAIEWIADNVLLAYRDKYYNKQNGKEELELIVSKARNGKTGTAEIGFHLPTQLLYNLDEPMPQSLYLYESQHSYI